MKETEESFNRHIRASGYSESLIKLNLTEKAQLEEVLIKTCAVWSELPGNIKAAIVMTLAAGHISDRLDVVSIALDELLDKVSEINSVIVKAIFSTDPKASALIETAKIKHTELVTKSKQYQKGLPEGYCKVMLALTTDTFVLAMKALEQAYTANTLLVTRSKLSSSENKEILDNFITRSMESWDHLTKATKSWISEPPNKYKIGQCRHEARHFEWMRREGMSEKDAIKIAMQAGVTYAAQYSFLAWFIDETH